MALTLKDYGLTDMPFIDISTLDPSSKDNRENGKIFVDTSSKQKIKKIMSRIDFGELVTYVSSSATTKGTGKSALMAAVYWELVKQGKPAIWTSALGGYTSGATVSRIFDAALSEGFVQELVKALGGEVTHEKLYEIVSESRHNPSRAIIDGLYKVMAQSEWEMPAKLANIKRSIITYGPTEVFGYFLAILKHLGMQRLIIFVDQFEDYVQVHVGQLAMQRLSDDWRGLLEVFRNKASLIVTTHPEAEQKIKQLTNYRLAPITSDSRIIVDPLEPKQGVELARAYIVEFRSDTFVGDALKPFDEKVIEFLTENTLGNPRALIGALRTAIRLAAEKDVRKIDLDFIKSPEIQGAMLLSRVRE
jgi:hypothetical protein